MSTLRPALRCTSCVRCVDTPASRRLVRHWFDVDDDWEATVSNAIVHRLVDGRWRVTDAPGDWVDDGRDYPEPKATDGIHEHEADAIRDYLERTSPRDPEDEPIDQTSEDAESEDS